MSLLLFVRGKPGTGKTTLSKRLSLVIPNTKIIDPDELGPKRTPGRIKLQKYRDNLEDAIHALRDGRSVIWNQPWRKAENIILTIQNIAVKLDLTTKEIFKGIQARHTNLLPFQVIIAELVTDMSTSYSRVQKKFKNFKQYQEYISKYKDIGEVPPGVTLIKGDDLDQIQQLITQNIKNKI